MSITQKLNISNLILVACVLLTVAAGYYGLDRETAIVNFVTGPGWQAADGAMESTIGMQRQMLELNYLTDKALQKQNLGNHLQQLHTAETFTDGALAAMRDSGLIPQQDLRRLDQYLAEFATLKQGLVTTLNAAAAGSLDEAALLRQTLQFRDRSQEFLNFLAELEEVGDSQVESQIVKVKDTERFAKSLLVLGGVLGVLISVLSMLYIRSYIVKPLQEARDRLRQIAEVDGDLTVELPVKSEDEIGEFSRYFNAFVAKIRATIRDIEASTVEVYRSSTDVQSATLRSSKTVDGQAGEIELVATAMNQMSATVEDVARNAAAAATATQKAEQQVRAGNDTVAVTRELIQRVDQENRNNVGVLSSLHAETESIGTVLEVIRGIAEQTNLLALNAAIEAARAGEQGRGFAVVADEVRTLATRTQQSTADIQNMIQRLQRGASGAVQAINITQQITNESVVQTDRVVQALNAVSDIISQISEMNIQISTATEQQSAVAQDISRNVHSINQASELVAETLGHNARGSDALLRNAERLQQLVGQFRIQH
ncbi:MAG: methyl-accepting chemotaxis protein [Gammaproteobacteria bacterium]|nr:methyl-accepting chemotaxis protein [Gammaproteobacteria bacterium]